MWPRTQCVFHLARFRNSNSVPGAYVPLSLSISRKSTFGARNATSSVLGGGHLMNQRSSSARRERASVRTIYEISGHNVRAKIRDRGELPRRDMEPRRNRDFISA